MRPFTKMVRPCTGSHKVLSNMRQDTLVYIQPSIFARIARKVFDRTLGVPTGHNGIGAAPVPAGVQPFYLAHEMYREQYIRESLADPFSIAVLKRLRNASCLVLYTISCCGIGRFPPGACCGI